jgi:hypothetical protein
MASLQKNNSWTAKAQTWDSIENRYTDRGDKHTRLVELIRHIKDSGLSQRLFGFTSMDKLVVSIYDPLNYTKESLHITFDSVNRKWHFEYYAQPFADPEFVRIYDEEKGIEKFDNFIKMIKW